VSVQVACDLVPEETAVMRRNAMQGVCDAMLPVHGAREEANEVAERVWCMRGKQEIRS
jgi:hypothetical protein